MIIKRFDSTANARAETDVVELESLNKYFYLCILDEDVSEMSSPSLCSNANVNYDIGL